MSDPSRSIQRSLESLRKEAKRWLAALRAGDSAAHERLAQVLPAAPDPPTLRDIQHAVAREHGFAGWSELKLAAEARHVAAPPTLARFEEMAAALLDAYRAGTPEAIERHWRLTWHRRSWQAMRTYVQLDLGKRPSSPDGDVAITLDDARYLIATEHGFASWDELRDFAGTASAMPHTNRPVALVGPDAVDSDDVLLASREWGAVLDALAARPAARVEAGGQMTDAVLARVAAIEGVTALALGGSKALGDGGARHLSRLPGLRHLDLSGTGITDAGLAFLRDLPRLETISLAGTRITDRGAAELRHCRDLRRIDLGGTACGDGAIRALAGMPALARLHAGERVTDDGIALLHELPRFRTWHGGRLEMSLLSYDAGPNQLTLRGSFTDRGVEQLRGLDGLFALNIDSGRLAITADAMRPLMDLPRLGWLAVDPEDDWMPQIAELAALRFLGAQDTKAGDDGFAALSRSRTLEYIWGRRCHNLGTRGFRALANLPALRGLSVSCLNVADEGIAALPDFPALRQLMPMDVPDASYRHIGRCSGLTSLILMYCRDTTDAATEHITALSALTDYFNSYTTITDRTPALLSTMVSLERITFDGCHGITDAGVRQLARLPRLRELRASGRGITAGVADGFAAGVRVVFGR